MLEAVRSALDALERLALQPAIDSFRSLLEKQGARLVETHVVLRGGRCAIWALMYPAEQDVGLTAPVARYFEVIDPGGVLLHLISEERQLVLAALARAYEEG